MMRIRCRWRMCGIFLAYGASISCGPHWATGMTGAPVARATRAAPVLPTIGHSCGSRVRRFLPDRCRRTRRALPRSTAALNASDASCVARKTGICPAPRSSLPMNGMSNSAALARKRGARPASYREVRERQRIRVREVVGTHDHPVGTRDVLHAVPIPPGERCQRRLQHDHSQPHPGTDVRRWHDPPPGRSPAGTAKESSLAAT